jgi:hypothetical protein
MKKNSIKISKHGRYFGGRYKSDGPYSGEAVRDEVFAPALENETAVSIDLSGTYIAASWLEEAFGGLVRYRGYTVRELRARLDILADQPVTVQQIWNYIESAEKDGE